MQTPIDVTDRIERLDAFEDRFGVRLDALSAYLEGDHGDSTLLIRGELHAVAGATIDDDIEIVVAVYDEKRRVAGMSTIDFYLDDFYVFAVFETSVTFSGDTFSRVRVYPQKS